MIDSFASEGPAVILMIIQSDYLGHIQMTEDIYVRRRCMTISVDAVSLVNWTHEGHKLARNNPVEVAILHFLVMLVLFCIECLEVVPTKAKSFLESFKAVKNCAFIEAVAFTGISERLEVRMIHLELSVCLLCVHLEDNHHESAHEEASVRDLTIVFAAAVVVNPCLPLERLTLKELGKLSAESVSHREIKRTKILIEGHIRQILREID